MISRRSLMSTDADDGIPIHTAGLAQNGFAVPPPPARPGPPKLPSVLPSPGSMRCRHLVGVDAAWFDGGSVGGVAGPHPTTIKIAARSVSIRASWHASRARSTLRIITAREDDGNLGI